jgi:hypothetical protein
MNWLSRFAKIFHIPGSLKRQGLALCPILSPHSWNKGVKMNQWHQLIIDSIKSLKLLTIVYEFERRTIEPYIYGRSSENHDVLRAYQTSGMSPGWRSFHIDKVQSLQESGDTFLEPRHDYRENDPGMEEVYYQFH